jgi:DNA-binding LacI/PurR family transcriptional regulator
MKSKNQLSIKDVAKKAGVSPATVSRVILKRDVVNHKTIVRVQDAINELGYVRERAPGRRWKYKMVAVLVPDIIDPFFHSLLKGISDIARIHHYSFVLFNSDNSEGHERENLKLSIEQNVDGIIIIPSGTDVEMFDNLIEKGNHVVFLDRVIDCDNYTYVVSDDEEGAYQGVKYLLHLGHRDILYIGGDKGLSTEKNRLKGHKKALEEVGISIKPELIREYSFNTEIIYDRTQEIIRSGLKFTAIFSASDLIALGVLKALEDIGRKVPDDVSLVGYGDMPFSSYLSLTTVSSPSYEMGKNAMLLVMDFIERRRNEPTKVVLRPSVIFRSSCQQKS